MCKTLRDGSAAWKSMLVGGTLCALTGLASFGAAAQSQSDGLRGLRGVLDALGQPQQGRAGSGVSRPDIGRTSGRDALVPPTPGVFPTKQSLIDAIRQGTLLEIRRASEGDKVKVVDSVYAILVNEGQVAPIKESCRPKFRSDVERVLFENSYMWSKGLNTTPPDFFAGSAAHVEEFKKSVADVENTWSRSDLSCDSQVGGRWTPHPYKQALLDLVDDYNKANSAYVQQEVARRKSIHATQVARDQEAARAQQAQIARDQATERASVQQRIDAEAARIRAEEQKRAERDRKRIGG